jgi:hypothetical protein
MKCDAGIGVSDYSLTEPITTSAPSAETAEFPLPFRPKTAYEPPAMTKIRLAIAIRIIGPAFRA